MEKTSVIPIGGNYDINDKLHVCQTRNSYKLDTASPRCGAEGHGSGLLSDSTGLGTRRLVLHLNQVSTVPYK